MFGKETGGKRGSEKERLLLMAQIFILVKVHCCQKEEAHLDSATIGPQKA